MFEIIEQLDKCKEGIRKIEILDRKVSKYLNNRVSKEEFNTKYDKEFIVDFSNYISELNKSIANGNICLDLIDKYILNNKSASINDILEDIKKNINSVISISRNKRKRVSDSIDLKELENYILTHLSVNDKIEKTDNDIDTWINIYLELTTETYYYD